MPYITKVISKAAETAPSHQSGRFPRWIQESVDAAVNKDALCEIQRRREDVREGDFFHFGPLSAYI